MIARVDLNGDVGEGFGAWQLGDDELLLRHVSSVNIACGFHAGDPSIMRRTLILAATHRVAAGAHPGLPDLAGFGRRRIDISAEEIYDGVVYQVGALLGFGRAAGIGIDHVKPHGALYNMAATNAGLAEAIAAAVADVDPGMVLFGLAGSLLLEQGERAGLRTASEVFADRGYEPDGTLTPRGEPGALITDPELAAGRAVRMVLEGRVTTTDGTDIPVRADTICVHGDSPNAAAIAQLLRVRLQRAGVRILSPLTP
jgi:5-oxoprolinase (ATP-hydrolysing) subunit A